MPVTGTDKDRQNYVDQRMRFQKGVWPELAKRWDDEHPGQRYKSETMSMVELWNLYSKGDSEELTEEEEARGKKPVKKANKGFDVIPMRTFELPGRYSVKGKHHQGKNGYLEFNHWLWARDQARKDLFWFGKEVFSMDYEPEVHQAVCNQFVQKDFDGVWREGY